MGDAPELPLRCVEARLFAAWVRNRPMPAFANSTNALYAAAWWARYTAREEAIAFAEALAKARGATASTMKRARDVAWRISDPAGFQQFGPPMKKRKKAEEKAKLEALRAAESVLLTVYKKVRRVARAAAKAVLEKDAQKASQLAARAQALGDVADAKMDECLAWVDPLSRLVDLMRAVRTEEALAIRAARAAAGHEAAAAAAARATAAGATAAAAAAAAAAAYNAAVYGIDE